MDASTEKPLRYKWLPADQQGLPATMASAAVAGLLSRAVTHPLDTAKALIQVRTQGQQNSTTFFGRSKTLQTLASVWKADGVRGLYRGFAITSALAVPATCLYFSSYELSKSHLLTHFQDKKDPQTSAKELSFKAALLLDLVCGFTAEAISCILYVPMDVCKERLQVYSVMRPEGLQAVKPSLREVAGGFRGLYSGYGATLLSFGPFSALFFTLNHQFSGVAKNFLSPYLSASPSGTGPRCHPLLDATVAGAAAGSAAFLTAPLDKVKLRLQVQREASARRQMPFYYRHLFHGLGALFKSEGLSGCFGGVGARVMFQSGCYFMTFLFMQSARNLYYRYFES